MEPGIRKMRNYNNPDSLLFEQAFTRGTFYLVLYFIIFIIIWLCCVVNFGNPLSSRYFLICLFAFPYFGYLLFVYGYFETGIEIDFISNRYRNYFSNGKLRFGKWNALELPDFLLIEKNTNPFNWWRTKTGFSRLRRDGLFSSDPYFYYQLFLITKGDKDHLIFTTEGFDFNLLTAKNLSNYLRIPVYERTIKGENLIYSPTRDQHNK